MKKEHVIKIYRNGWFLLYSGGDFNKIVLYEKQ